MTATTDTDRYALALATIGLHAAGLTAEAVRAEDTNPGQAAHLEAQAAALRALLLAVIHADLMEECPELDADERTYQAYRHRSRILRVSKAKIRGDRS